ncbi:MAG: heavy-metal-associated domain-containing protein [Bacteroidales bacterium]|nr:heavy-metal-associated domain-containing protein [Bacteroidales bacterium]
MLKKTIANYLVIILAAILLFSCGRDKKTEKADLLNETSFIEVSIGGMTCTGCEQTIQASVSRMDGIKTVKASHTKGIALIEYAPALVDTIKIKDAISGSGYTVKKFTSIAQ